MSDSILSRYRLENGLEVVFHDQSNRYFGDYHQVKILVVCRVPVSEALISRYLSADDLAKARQLFGEHVDYKKQLKQMGVPGAEVDSVKEALVENFTKNAATYMQGGDFASRFVARRLAEHRNKSRLHLVGYD